jgi:hypothetical protein
VRCGDTEVRWIVGVCQDSVKGLQVALMARSRLEEQKHDHGVTYVDG